MELIDLVNSVKISNDLTQMVKFPILLDLFISSGASICLTMAFPSLGNSDHVVVSVLIDFLSNSKQDALFLPIAYDYYRADWDSLCDHLRDVSCKDTFKLSAFAAASEFCDWVQVGIDVNVLHRKYQIKPHSSQWFSAACVAAIVPRNHFFRLYQQKKYSESKVILRQASNHCKVVLEAAKLAYANKTKERIASSVLIKCKLAWSCCLWQLIKQNCLLKTFLRILILITWVSL